MADFQFAQGRGAQTGDMSVDAGLRQFMLGVYSKLFFGILLAGALAYAAGTIEPLTALVFNTPLMYIVAFGPPVLILGSSFLMKSPSPLATGILYWTIVTLIGLGMGVYFFFASEGVDFSTMGGIKQSLTYATIVKAFLITATAFGALSLWGYTTKRDLSGLGTFLVMAMWILFAVAIVYAILPMTGLLQPSGPMEWIISGGFALISAILIAVQTQQLKHDYYAFGGDARSVAVMTNWGALNFFIMFVNVFRFVLMLLSSRE